MKKMFKEAEIELITIDRDIITASLGNTGANQGTQSGSNIPDLDGNG